MTTTRTYDNLNRLTQISSSNPQSVVLDSHGYAYNSANQRTGVTNADGSFWVFQYDALGQVTSGLKYWPDSTLVAGQQFGYDFDNIGNRQGTSAGGDQWGGNLRYANYAANTLNQYTNRTVPGAIEVIGTATNTSTVTVNNNPTYRRGSYYRLALPVANDSAPTYTSVTNLAVLNNGTNPDLLTNLTGNVFLPKTPENFTYDGDGNLSQDGRWQYTWDAENRLVSLQGLSTLPTTAKLKLDFVYDAQGRRVQKTVSTNNGSIYVAQYTNRFVYDGWNLLAVLNPQSAILQSFIWGLDLSGQLQGAGGVGGLLSVRDAASGTRSFFSYDGNGNVSAMVDSATSAVTGQFEYGPFGEVIRLSGQAAKGSQFRFSTKYQDNETDLLYYGYRYYSAATGRWLSRDPIVERGGLALYGFVRNDPTCFHDRLGKLTVDFTGAGSTIAVTIIPTLSVSDVCHGGPLHFNVSFEASYNDQGEHWMDSSGAWFTFDGSRVPIANFQDDPMRWDVAFSKQLPMCPTGRQSGSVNFDAGDSTDGRVLTIIFDWHYRCDCECKETDPFKPSYTYFAFPPIKPLPRLPGPILL